MSSSFSGNAAPCIMYVCVCRYIHISHLHLRYSDFPLKSIIMKKAKPKERDSEPSLVIISRWIYISCSYSLTTSFTFKLLVPRLCIHRCQHHSNQEHYCWAWYRSTKVVLERKLKHKSCNLFWFNRNENLYLISIY